MTPDGHRELQRTTCPVCGSPTGDPFITIVDQPVHCNVLWDTADAARSAPRGDLDLVFCGGCGHVYNASFDAALTTYGGTYENSLHHSGVFQEYADELVRSLIERHDIVDRDVVEVGAGQGDFLQMLCAAGSNRGVGFDPSHVGAERPSDDVRVVASFYGEQFADEPADVIVSRHVLEHIDDSGEFVKMIRRVIGDRSTLAFFEVPNAEWTLRDGGIWDLIYEHCGYFTPPSLAEAFRLGGFDIDRIGSVFGGQFLTIEAMPRPENAIGARPAVTRDEVARVAEDVDRFADLHRAEVERWSSELASLGDDGRRAVIWGAGSKGVTFLNTVGEAETIDRAVDINPRKVGKFVSGTGQRIVEPADLVASPPDVVVVMNPNYRDEIAQNLRDLGISATVLCA